MHGEAAGDGCGSLSYVQYVLLWSSQPPSWQVNKYISFFFEGGGLRRLVVSYDEVRGRISFVICDKLKFVVRVAATGVVFDDLLKNSFIEFIVIRNCFL